MKLKVFQSGAGDALIVESTSTAETKRMLVDAGEPEAYDAYMADRLGDMRKRNESLDVVYVSHIDRDHIGGVLRILDAEVAWRIFHRLEGEPNARPKPATPRPPEVKEIWHNAFFEDAAMNTPEIVSTLSATGTVILGHLDPAIRMEGLRTANLAQSVGDAIEVSRRIGQDQLGIALNKDATGSFLLLKDGLSIPDVGPLQVTILGPTPENLRGLLDDWNAWLKDKAGYLAKLIKGHELDEQLLTSNNPQAPILMAEAQADQLATSTARVTPPNVASLMMMIEEDGRRILLTGDGDDKDILGGLDKQDLLDGDGSIHVEVLKVPHHGANNSFTADLAERVTADHYLFCGNGDHGNPEPDVVKGYVMARRKLAATANPKPEHLRAMKLWFNHSHAEARKEEDEREARGKRRDDKRVDQWEALENLVKDLQSEGAKPRLRSRFLKRARSMTFRVR